MGRIWIIGVDGTVGYVASGRAKKHCVVEKQKPTQCFCLNGSNQEIGMKTKQQILDALVAGDKPKKKNPKNQTARPDDKVAFAGLVTKLKRKQEEHK